MISGCRLRRKFGNRCPEDLLGEDLSAHFAIEVQNVAVYRSISAMGKPTMALMVM